MKLISLLITKNMATYGGVIILRQTVLYVFVPDGNGMRYKKTVNGVTTNYYYDGTQLLMESRDAERIWYVYGATGIEGISYQHEIYYFDKNTLGDVVAIRDDLGNILATYEYDAWEKDFKKKSVKT